MLFRANNKCNVNLLGIGSSVYAEVIIFIAEIAGVADLLEDIFSGGGVSASKEATTRLLEKQDVIARSTNEITNQVQR